MTASSRNDTATRDIMSSQWEKIPSWLQSLPQWVCHRAKVPYNPMTGKKADTTDPRTWGSFKAAARALATGRYDGLGLVLAHGIGGMDLDHCRNPETGEIAKWAQILMARIETYAEVSPSGTGAHILFHATVPKGRKRAYFDGVVEMYGVPTGGRFFTVTGAHIDWTPCDLLDSDQDLINRIYKELWPIEPETPPAPSQTHTALSMDDSELLTRARNNPDAAKARRFIALYDRGDPLSYNSLSERDLALCNDLAYLCGSGAEDRVASLFRASACYREKADRDDYVNRTVAKAYEGRTAFYQPREKKSIDFETTETAPESAPENQLNNSDDGETGDELARLQAENARMRQQLAQIRAIVNADGMQVAPLEKVIQIDFIVNTFADEKRRNADGFTTIVIEGRKDEETGKLKGKPGLVDKHGMSRGSITKALDNIEAFGTVRFGHTEPVKMSSGQKIEYRTVAPPIRFAPKWERIGGPRKKMGGARPGAGRPRKAGEPCDEPQCIGVLIERRGVDVKEHEWVETVCPNCDKIHAPRAYTGVVATVETRCYTPQKNQLISDDQDAVSAWPDIAAAKSAQSQSVDASVHKIDFPPPPARPSICCESYDWQLIDGRWRCGKCLPVAVAAAG